MSRNNIKRSEVRQAAHAGSWYSSSSEFVF